VVEMVAGACNDFLIVPAFSRSYSAPASRAIAIRINFVPWDRGNAPDVSWPDT